MRAPLTIDLEQELSESEIRMFEANAALRGRTAGQHLRALIFGERAAPQATSPTPKKKEAKR